MVKKTTLDLSEQILAGGLHSPEVISLIKNGVEGEWRAGAADTLQALELIATVIRRSNL